jgi:hypothetical protein
MTDERKAAADIRSDDWPAPSRTSPGWKIDPADRKRTRYWDGGEWGDESLTPFEVQKRLREASGEPQRVVVENKKGATISGCGTLFIVFLVIGLAATAWDGCFGEDEPESDAPNTSRSQNPRPAVPSAPAPTPAPATLKRSQCEADTFPEVCDIAAEVIGRKAMIAAIALPGGGVSYSWNLPFSFMGDAAQATAIQQSAKLFRRTFRTFGDRLSYVDAAAYETGQGPFDGAPKFAASVDAADVTGDPIDAAQVTAGGMP